MTIWSDPDIADEIVRRYLAGEGPSEIAKSYDLTRNQVLSKMVRLGHVRRRPSEPGRSVARGRPRGQGASRTEAKTNAPLAQRIARVLERGPQTSIDLAEMLGTQRRAVGKVISGMIAQGRVERSGKLPGDRGFQYALRAGGDFKHVSRGDLARELEERYVAARKLGSMPGELALALKLSATSSSELEKAYRFQTTAGFSTDNSCPKFAEHERHLEAVALLGAYPVMPRLADLRRPA